MQNLAEIIDPNARFAATIAAACALDESLRAVGRFRFECRGPGGTLKWEDEIINTVMTLGKNAILNNTLTGSAYTVTGPFLGLISSTSFTGISAADTMASHAGWLEAGNANAPTYTAPRKTAVFSAASAGSIALSAALAFAITGTGTIEGGFMTFQSGAVSTIDNTSGTLLSAAIFTGGTRPVISGDTVNVSWSLGL